ncbi:MAG: hypothetical protein V1722_04145 [Candidatus Micrarchaeota archaeon]
MRLISDRNILDDVCIKFCSVLERHCEYIVVSGYVAISTGRSRGTEDIDIITQKISLSDFLTLHYALEKEGFECVQSNDPTHIYTLYLADNLPVRYILKNQVLPEIELKMAKDILDEMQLKERIKIPITGLPVWFSSVEYNLAFKEELLKSDKDLEDALHLRRVFEGQINEEKINSIKQLIIKLRLNNGSKQNRTN